jgi:hypothetical protein
MGRYLSGTADFRYKYATAKQPNNLCDLASYLKAGRGSLVPMFEAVRSLERKTFKIVATVPCMALVRNLSCRGIEMLPGEGDVLETDTMESLEQVIADEVVDVVLRIDELLVEVPTRIIFFAHQRFVLMRSDWDAALQRINDRLASPLCLKDLEERFDSTLQALGDADQHLPSMALFILAHAVEHDLDMMEVREEDESLISVDFWQMLSRRGPRILGRWRPRTTEQWLVRGIVEFLQNEHEAARLSLRVALQRDDSRARRWLDVLGVNRSERKRRIDEADVAPDVPDSE